MVWRVALRPAGRAAGERRPAWGLRLLAVLALTWAMGCENLGQAFEYRGSRRLDDGDYRVSAVAWLDRLPLVFALRTEAADGPRMLRLVPLGITGIEPCSTQPATRFIASGADGVYRVGVLDGSTAEFALYDLLCEPTGLALSGIVRLDYLDQEHYRLVTEDGAVLVVQPFAGTVATLGQEVWATGAAPVFVRRPEGSEPAFERALWVLDADVLELRDLAGRGLGPRYTGVRSFATHRGESSLPARLLAYTDDAGVTVVEARNNGTLDEQGEVPAKPLLTREGACEPRLVDLAREVDLDACVGPQCEQLRAAGLEGRAVLRRPFLAVKAPCGSRTLVLYDVYEPTVKRQVGAEVIRFVVAETLVGGESVMLYEVPGEDRPHTYYRVGDEDPLDMGVWVDLDNWVEESAVFPVMRLRTLENPARYGRWSPEAGFTPLLTDVVPSGQQELVQHAMQDGRGVLSLCGFQSCVELARGVPQDRFREYQTLERIDDGPKVIAFIQDVADTQGAGTLTVVRRTDGFRVEVDTGVTSFAPVENGPARGIVYSVGGDPAREGLWFAPR